MDWSAFRTPLHLPERAEEAYTQLQAWLNDVEEQVPPDRLPFEKNYHHLKEYANDAHHFKRWFMSLGETLKELVVDDLPQPQVTATGRNPVGTLIARNIPSAHSYIECEAKHGRQGLETCIPLHKYCSVITRLEYALATRMTLCVQVRGECRYSDTLNRIIFTVPVWMTQDCVMQLPGSLIYPQLHSLCVEAELMREEEWRMVEILVQHVLALEPPHSNRCVTIASNNCLMPPIVAQC
jgi:hypothetical protein